MTEDPLAARSADAQRCGSAGAAPSSGRPVQGPSGAAAQDPACPWAGLWSRLQDMELDRDHRALAWRILHACVLCEAFRMYLVGSPQQDAVCPFLCCDHVC